MEQGFRRNKTTGNAVFGSFRLSSLKANECHLVTIYKKFSMNSLLDETLQVAPQRYISECLETPNEITLFSTFGTINHLMPVALVKKLLPKQTKIVCIFTLITGKPSATFAHTF